MKKIILFSPILQHYRLTFYEKLSKASNEFELVVFHGVKKKEDGRPGFSGETNFLNKGFRQFISKSKLFHIVYNQGMLREIKKINPDILILQGIPGNLSYRQCINWAHRKGRKVIIWACGFDPGRASGVFLRFKNYLVRSYFNKADYFLTYSTNGSKYVKSFGVENSIIKTAFNGIETDNLIRNHEATIKESKRIIDELNLKDNKTFLYVGALGRSKKLDLLINAFSELRNTRNNIKLIIIGDGPDRNSLEAYLKKLDDPNILYMGRIVDGVDAYFAATDCFVLPGVGGLGLNQAMYWKKICIVGEADGTEDDLVIDNETGFRFIKDDVKSLITAMNRMLETSKEDIARMTDTGHKLILDRSNVNRMVEDFTKIIEKLSSN